MKLLSTGELATLFSLSKYTIRHYIEIELLIPHQKNKNGYYCFDEENIYTLYQIIVFRNIGYSLNEIKRILTHDTLVDALETAKTNLQQKIDELFAIKSTVNNILEAQKSYKLNEVVYFERTTRYFKTLPSIALENGQVNLLKAAKAKITPLDEVFYVTSKTLPHIPCLECEEEESAFDFPKGTYACKSFLVKDEACISENVALFLSDMLLTVNGLSQNELLLYENIPCSLAYNNETVFSMEIKL
ncbi:MerR family transcriptional regulator [Vagococcus entomophilus]|uniref:HTH merR-type domain-containing protein n=1 Tax=Vagococcus entomophilus TaxID=1160095 RepID=A0A430AJZ6_9ENTE|nr:MerR family transcriptional regulator [Vagococcus entomophilus]RSU08247.1 hypothetical protein CBF30_03120 [Vagococcus entomophilus]